jgi:hypothetical protein
MYPTEGIAEIEYRVGAVQKVRPSYVMAAGLGTPPKLAWGIKFRLLF